VPATDVTVALLRRSHHASVLPTTRFLQISAKVTPSGASRDGDRPMRLQALVLCSAENDKLKCLCVWDFEEMGEETGARRTRW